MHAHSRKKAVPELHELIAEVDAVGDDAPEVLWVADEKSGRHSISRNVAGLIGYTSAELRDIGRRLISLVHPEDRIAVAGHERRLGVHGYSRQSYRVRHKAGHYVAIDETVRRVASAGDGAPAIMGVMRRMDGEEEQVHGEKRESGAQLYQLISAIQDYAIVLLDRGGQILTWNDGAEAFLGFKESELVGRHFSAIFPDDGKEVTAQLLKIALEDGVLQCEGTLRKRSGEICRAHLTLRPVQRGVRTPRWGFALVLRDTRDQYAHEQYLRLAEAGFLYSPNPAICFQRSTKTGRIESVRANELASRLVLDLLGIKDISLPDIENALRGPTVSGGAELMKLLSEGRSFDCEIEVRAPTRTHTLEFHASEPHQQDSMFSVQVVVLADNEGKSVEQNRFQHAQRVELVGLLAGGVAHDFNNILVVTLGNLQMLRDELELRGVGGEPMDLLEEAVRAMRQGESLTRSLTRLSRREPFELQAVQVGDVLKGAVEICKRTLPSNIAFTTAMDPPDPPMVYASSSFFESSLLNLVINSRDSMPRGGEIRLTVGVVRIDSKVPYAAVRAGEYVEISCADTGCGMSPETRARCFEAMYTTKPRGAGTGLGLWAVREFARSCGGDAFVKSAETGKGTTISILLPVARSARASGGVSGTRMESSRALVVDDNPSVRKLAGRLLSQASFKIMEAENAVNALASIQSGQVPDLVVTDILMPGRLNGLDLVEALESSVPAVPIVVITASQKAAAEARARFGKRHLVLEKPFEPKAFVAACRHAVEVAPSQG